MNNIIGFKNTNILTEEGIKKTSLLISNGYISKIGIESSDNLIELDDKYIVIPGLIDEHIHGAKGTDAIAKAVANDGCA